MQKNLSRLPRNVWVMSATSLLNDISSEMLLNLIPFFLANILGVRTAVIGLIEGVAETTAGRVHMGNAHRRNCRLVSIRGLHELQNDFYCSIAWRCSCHIFPSRSTWRRQRRCSAGGGAAIRSNRSARLLGFGHHRRLEASHGHAG